MDSNASQTETPTAGNIAPPPRIWFRAHKNPVTWKKIWREIKRPFIQYLYAPIDIVRNRMSKLKQAEQEFGLHFDGDIFRQKVVHESSSFFSCGGIFKSSAGGGIGDAEDGEKITHKHLCFGFFIASVFPSQGKGDGVRLYVIPREHGIILTCLARVLAL